MLIQKKESNDTSNNNGSSQTENTKSSGSLAKSENKLTKEMSINFDYDIELTRKEKCRICCNKCSNAISHSINIIKAVIMRLIFSLHSFVAICIVYTINQELWCLVNIVGVVFMMIELFVTIIKRKGKEPKWFFPSFFIYICTMIPPIWFIELFRIENNKQARNSTAFALSGLDFEFLQSSLTEIGLNSELIPMNVTKMPVLTHENAAVYLEISLMLLVILGRWFLPKGSISRSTLSQLLLVYMSLASDIVDLLSLLNETQIQENMVMVYFTLVIFSWSLFQFSLNLVVTRGRSFVGIADDNLIDEIDSDDTKEKSEFSGVSRISVKSRLLSFGAFKFLRFDLLDSEIWSILVTLAFQDGPFLALRLTAVFRFNVRTFVTMFFTCKNGIILFLQIYRLSAICSENKDEDDGDAGGGDNTLSIKVNEVPGAGTLIRNASINRLSLPNGVGTKNEESCCPCQCHAKATLIALNRSMSIKK